jgi:hypothetical protein
MKVVRLLAVAGFAAVTLASAGQAAVAQPGPPPQHCPPGYHWDSELGECVPNPPPPPTPHQPQLAVDGVRQTHTRDGIHVFGWAADPDSPVTPLTVSITVDGRQVASVAANKARPDVAAAYPQYGADHGYDLVVPTSPGEHGVCVTAGDIGGGHTDTTACQRMDTVVRFDAAAVAYDVTHTVVTDNSLEQLDHLDRKNSSNITQGPFELSGSKTFEDKHGWSDTFGAEVKVSGGIGIPLLADGQISVTGSFNYTQDGSQTTQTTFSWRDDIDVPAKSEIVATIAVSRSSLTVPYTMTGNYVYRTGVLETGSLPGTYTGICSHDIAETIDQYNLDGSPAAHPAPQSTPTLLMRRVGTRQHGHTAV